MFRNLLVAVCVITLSITLHSINAVDRSNFKTCDQSGFCKRNRAINPEHNKWIIPIESVTAGSGDDSVHFNLKNVANGVTFQAELTSLLSGQSFRLRVDELNSPKKRFDSESFVLTSNLKKSKVKITDQSMTGFTVQVNDEANKQTNRFVLTADPFRVDVYSGDQLVMVGNQRGLFNFEHYRPKPQGLFAKTIFNMAKWFMSNSEGDTNADECTESCWEEQFKSSTDSKPNGPMSVGMDFTFVDFDHVYGIPSHADSFALRNTKGTTDPYRLYNVDIFEYEVNSPMSLYGAYPLMIAHSAKPLTVGLFWLNPSETWIDIESSNSGITGLISNLVSEQKPNKLTHWISETGMIDVFFLLGPSVSRVMEQNAQLFGTTNLPPIYSIGYHQCRWNYFSQEEVADVDTKADMYDIPMDAIWLDIEYTEGRSKKYFTWDPVTFSDHVSLIKNLTSKGRRLITIIDPHLKKESNYATYDESVANNYLMKDAKEDKEFEGWCWPGKFSLARLSQSGYCIVDIWNDMNEPSVFSGPEITAPRDIKHIGDVEHRELHNMYGLLMTQSTYSGLVKHRSNLRPFILTRSFFTGSQRSAAVWTGDNMSKWEHLKISIPMLLSHSVTGISFIGADIAGFFFNPESEEIVIRWYQASVFHPFMRAHAHLDTKRREPWVYPDFTRNAIRDVIRTRYTYLPYMYQLFRENERNGMPPMRPLWMQFPTDSKTLSIETSYLLGSNLLVAPVLDKEINSLEIYLPTDAHEPTNWLNVWTHKVFAGGQSHVFDVDIRSLPIFQRSGSIIPKRERLRRAAVLAVNDPISLQIFLNPNGEATGSIYLDDGQSFDYRTKNAFIEGTFHFSKRILNYSFESGKPDANPAWLERVTIFGYPSKPNRILAQMASDSSKQTQLAFKYNAEDKTVVIRKPSFTFGQNWQIKIM
ncbi:hypothetical protein BLOT_011003 [Blomia tropicalis]|nr:hypothetical protein BLOT_011003 [Blomia tropicalis]